MDTTHKVRFSAAAQWLLDGFALLKAAPLRMTALGLIYGMVLTGLGMLRPAQPMLALLVQLVLVLLGPVLVAGMVWGAREVQQRQTTSPEAFAEPVKRGRVGALLTVLLPQVGLGILMGALFFIMVGKDNAQVMVRIYEQMQTRPNAVDPALLAALPAGALLAWCAVVFLLSVVSFLVTFVAIPDILFGSGHGIAAMRRSLKACMRNLPTVLLFLVLVVVMVLVFSVIANVLALFAGLLLGPAAVQWMATLMLSAVLMPVLSAALLRAWQDMLGGMAPPVIPAPASPVLVA